MSTDLTFATGRFPQAIRFVLVNNRVPRTDQHCALCGGLIEKGYVRDSQTPLPKSEEWDGRMYGRLAALPDQAEPLQRSRLLAALSVGTAIIQLRHMAPHLGAAAELDAPFAALARGKSAIAIPQLRQLDYRLAGSDTGPETAIALGARSRLLVISEALAVHHDRTAPGHKPLRLTAIRLASGSVRFCRLHHLSFVLDTACCEEFIMTITEVKLKSDKMAEDREAIRKLDPTSRAPARRRMRILPFLITLTAGARDHGSGRARPP